MTKETLVVNLYAGPGAGKSTCAAYIFAKLKMAGINAELVTEYAKDTTWEGANEKLKCQLYITGKQAYRMMRVYGKVDVIVTDSPLAMGAMYTNERLIKEVCYAENAKYRNQLNYFIERTGAYCSAGRNQTQAEAIEIDHMIKLMLSTNGITYDSFTRGEGGCDRVVEKVKSMIAERYV